MRSVYKIDMTAFTTSNAFIKLIIEILTRGKITANDYGTRAMILSDIPIFSKRHCTRTISSLLSAMIARFTMRILIATKM